jgi:hypothetical protein
MVVAAGGDGTIGLIARQLFGARTALGILPLGSVMNIPRMLGVPRDLEGAAGILADGQASTIDVGRVGDHIFYEAGSVGMHAAATRELPKVTGDRRRPFVVAAVAIDPPSCASGADGDRTSGRQRSSSRWPAGLGTPIPPDASLRWPVRRARLPA